MERKEKRRLMPRDLSSLRKKKDIEHKELELADDPKAKGTTLDGKGVVVDSAPSEVPADVSNLIREYLTLKKAEKEIAEEIKKLKPQVEKIAEKVWQKDIEGKPFLWSQSQGMGVRLTTRGGGRVLDDVRAMEYAKGRNLDCIDTVESLNVDKFTALAKQEVISVEVLSSLMIPGPAPTKVAMIIDKKPATPDEE
jgi:hypothetical protein